MTEKQRELKKIGYYDLDYEANEQDIRIGRILGKIDMPVSDKSLKIFLKYLEKKLQLPCEVKGMNDLRGMKFNLLEVN
jgi:hypothetical protein